MRSTLVSASQRSSWSVGYVRRAMGIFVAAPSRKPPRTSRLTRSAAANGWMVICGSLYKKLLISRLQRRGGAVKSIGKSLPLMALVAHEAGASIRLVARAGGIPTSRAYNLIRHGQAVSPGALLAGATPITERKEVTMTTALQAPT